jgi:hypothetical protein
MSLGTSPRPVGNAADLCVRAHVAHTVPETHPDCQNAQKQDALGSHAIWKANETKKDSYTVGSRRTAPMIPTTTSPVLIYTGVVLRTLLLDVPLLLALILYSTTSWLEYVKTNYMLPQLELQRWTPERAEQEVTYFHRRCDESDQSAHDTEPLVIDYSSMSKRDKMEHMLTHGVSVYPNLLSAETANEVRDFILAQNLKNEDMIDVIENTNRWSFGVRVDQHPSVSKALKEVLNKPELVEGLEAILGKNPAIIEFTGITSAYGATAQRWHQDVVPEGSAAKYSRSFVPSYSLFIPLQNTTKAIGATDICPGTHMCAAGPIHFCEYSGFPVSGAADNWPLGWGALVNQQTTHRGAPHVDPHGPSRVLFILTFAPRPQFTPSKLETRMISTGGSYSLHWSQWGHTLRDFQDPDTRMKQPWRALRALGLYKPRDAQWGWDYLSQASGRVANDEEGFHRESLDGQLSKGGLTFLPDWLQGHASTDEETSYAWVEFMEDTLRLCSHTTQKFYLAVVFGYGSFVVIWNGFLFAAGRRHFRVKAIGRSMLRVLLLHAVILSIEEFARRRLAVTDWAKSIRGSRLYRLPSPDQNLPLPGTLLLLEDVLILDQFQSEHLGSYDRILDFAHPGNRRFNTMILQHSKGYTALPFSLKRSLRADVLLWNKQDGSRILAKNVDGAWAEVAQETAEKACHKKLTRASNSGVEHVSRQLDYLKAENIYGFWRHTSMYLRHNPVLLDRLERKLLGWNETSKNSSAGLSSSNGSLLLRPFFRGHSIPLLTQKSLRSVRQVLPPRPSTSEPFAGAWMQEGDVVEGRYHGNFPEWYRGRIVSTSADKDVWDVEYDDGDEDVGLCRNCVRPFVPYALNDDVEWRDEEDIFHRARVVKIQSGDVYDLKFEDGSIRSNASATDLRRVPLLGEIEVGSRVEFLVDEGYNTGTILHVNVDGSYNIEFDDGDFATNVAPKHVIPE